MSASVKAFIVSDEVLESRESQSVSYADIDVPADYEAELTKVEDYGPEENPKGWILTFRLEGLPFKFWVPFSDAARWKLVDTVRAFDPTFFDVRTETGETRPINMNEYVGRVVGAHVVLDTELDTPRKVIDYLFQHTGTEPGPEDVPVM